jgi:1-aminocyclopropane-1-carboxylate deaminase/D-cysteine desulfhydrase-like pyridoxal-dependent ACC family enzyme
MRQDRIETTRFQEQIARYRARLDAFPRVDLAHLPTPLDACANLTASLGGPRIWIKRDDCTGLAFGGNKVRQHEFVLGAALAEGADCFVQGAASQSNHSRQLAAAGARLGIETYLLPKQDHMSSPIRGNYLLDHLLGATITPIDLSASTIEAKAKLVEELRAQGRHPYITGMGADDSLVLAAVAYVDAVFEIVEALADDELPDWIYTASQGSTQAGLLVGCEILGLSTRVLGVCPMDDRHEAYLSRQQILELAHGAARLLGYESALTLDDILTTEEFVGEGYGLPTDTAIEAIRTVASTEGTLLDPVYTGKAFSALLAHVRSGRLAQGENVIFVHTGGLPALFAYGDLLITREADDVVV